MNRLLLKLFKNNRSIIQYMSQQCSTFTNTNILFFNFISFITGGYFILKNFEDLNKPEGIQDCYHIFLLCCFAVLNNLVPLIGCFQFTGISIFAFLCSLLLGSYNTYNFTIISNNCSTYFISEYKGIWYYYYGAFAIQMLNVLMYIFKFHIFLCGKRPVEKNDEETQTLINPIINNNALPAHIYDVIEDFFVNLLDNSLIPSNINLDISDKTD